MKDVDVGQARAAVAAGGVLSALLVSEGPDFVIELETRSAGTVRLVRSNGRQVRRFANPLRALALLRELGIFQGRFSLMGWCPGERAVGCPTRPDRAEALKAVHLAAASKDIGALLGKRPK